MAAIMDSIAFCQITNENDLLSVSRSNSDDCIQISSKRQTFDILKLSDQKTVKSWSLRHGVTVTSSVIWESQQERFITVINNEDVKVWETDTADFDKAKRKHSSRKIHQLLPVAGHDLVVVYTDGSVGFLADLKSHTREGLLSDTDTIYWCQAGSLQSTIYVMAVVKSKEEVRLHTSWYHSDTDTWTHSNSALSYTASELCSCDCYTYTDVVSLYLMGSTGDLLCLRVTENSVSETGSARRIPGVSGNSSLITLDDTHVAIANVQNGKEVGVCIYDTKFGIQHAWESLPEKPKSKAKIFSVHGHLFVPCGRTLYMYKYTCEPSSVVSLLGQGMSSQLTDMNAIPGHYRWSAGHTVQKDNAHPTDLADSFTKLCHTKLALKEFRASFRKLRTELQKTENHHWLMSNHMSLLIRRIIDESSFWPGAEVKQLIELQCIPQSLLGSWVECLVHHNEVELVHLVMDSLPNIPEVCLCRAISFYLECKEELLQLKDSGPDDEEPVGPLNTCRARLVNRVLLLPYSDVFLLECLRNIGFTHAIKLLEYLSYLLEHGSLVPHSSSSTQPRVPSREQVADWLSLLLDAHMTHFGLSPDCHVSLVKLQTVVTSQVQLYDSLGSLEPLLERLKAKSSVVHDRAVGQYCIEVLHI